MNAPMRKLSPKLEHAALLEARGELTHAEVAAKVGLTAQYIYTQRLKPAFKLRVKHHRAEIENRHYDASADLQKEFDAEAPKAFKTIAQLHKKADRDTTRLGAAKEILDRSSIAPAKRDWSDKDSGGVVIQIGVKKLEQIYAALEDVDDHETINLLEGEWEEKE